MKPGYCHFYFSQENCIRTRDYSRCSAISGRFTKLECSSTICLYSIWPAPVASGNTPGIDFSFCLSHFLMSQRGCRLSGRLNPPAAAVPDHSVSILLCLSQSGGVGGVRKRRHTDAIGGPFSPMTPIVPAIGSCVQIPGANVINHSVQRSPAGH